MSGCVLKRNKSFMGRPFIILFGIEGFKFWVKLNGLNEIKTLKTVRNFGVTL